MWLYQRRAGDERVTVVSFGSGSGGEETEIRFRCEDYRIGTWVSSRSSGGSWFRRTVDLVWWWFRRHLKSCVNCCLWVCSWREKKARGNLVLVTDLRKFDKCVFDLVMRVLKKERVKSGILYFFSFFPDFLAIFLGLGRYEF